MFDPMSAFQIGKEIGHARSPVSGLGDALRNILDDARKKGLLQAQSQFQAAGANQNAILSENREAARGKEQIPFVTVGPGGQVDSTRTVARDAKVVTEPAQTQNIFEQVEAFKKAQAARQSPITPTTGTDFTSEDEVIQAFQSKQIQIGDVISINGKQFRFDGI